MELGEPPEEAALRELSEETSLAGKIDLLLGVTTSPSDAYGSVLMVGYLVKNFTGSPKAEDDALEVAWFGADALPEIAFTSHSQFIRIYLALDV